MLNCFHFALLCSVIGLKISCHLLNQSDIKPKPIANWSYSFHDRINRAWYRLRGFTLSSHWFIVLFTFVMIGHCNCFGFGFTTLNWKPLYYQNNLYLPCGGAVPGFGGGGVGRSVGGLGPQLSVKDMSSMAICCLLFVRTPFNFIWKISCTICEW